MPEAASAVATLLTARDPEERRRALEALAADPTRALALLEAALPDLLRDAPEALGAAARLAAGGARGGDSPAGRLLDLLSRVSSPDEARLSALGALRGGGSTAERGGFARALEEMALGLPPSPLRDKLARVAQAAALAPEVAARAFAAAYEAARAASDERLLAFSREKLAPTLEEHGLAAVFDRTADEGAFDVRPATGSGASAGELGRPAIRSRAGAVVVRGVAFVAAPSTSAAPAPATAEELIATVARALAVGASPEVQEAALSALDSLRAIISNRRSAHSADSPPSSP